MNPLLILLALSLAANALIGHAWLGTRDDLATVTATTTQQIAQARTAAKTCNDATETLQEAGRQRSAAAARALDAARAQAAPLQASADTILLTPASTPGDDCRSARDRANNWLQGRALRRATDKDSLPVAAPARAAGSPAKGAP